MMILFAERKMASRTVLVWAMAILLLLLHFASVVGAAETHTYVFDPCQSTVLERNWSWGYYEAWYYIEGEFQFSVDFNDVVGTAGFDWVDGNLTDEVFYCEDGMQTTESLDVLFHMTDLNCIDGNAASISFLYEKNNPTFPNADVNVIVTFVGDSIHISGRFSEECYDGSQYDLNAVGVLKKYGGGLGTGNYPYLIYDANQMNAIGADSNDWDAHFKLMADIDLGGYTGTSFNIIGNSSTAFTGVFDGNVHTISNFSYSAATGLRIGLFGVIDNPNAEIRDVVLIDPNISLGMGDHIGGLVGLVRDGNVSGCYVEGGYISARNYIGGLVGTMDDGSITNSHANGSISGQGYVGGLVGWAGGDVSNCFFDGSVSGTDGVGGLAGRLSWFFANVSNCYSAGSVTGEGSVGGLIGFSGGGASISDCNSRSTVVGEEPVGGLIGYNATEEQGWVDYPSTVSRCVSLGEVVGVAVVGGLVGRNSGNIIDCNSSVSMSGRYGGDVYDVGGLVGYNSGLISGCHSSGILVGSGNTGVGGLVSWNSGEIVDSYSERTVSGDGYGTGGLAGYNSGIISESFATGNVSARAAVGGLVGKNEGELFVCYATVGVSGEDYVGGLVGLNYYFDGNGISNCYSIGDVNGTRYYAGGFVGLNAYGVISNCYSAGNVKGTTGVGGFVGRQGDSCFYQGNFWDSDVNPDVNGIGNGSDPNVIGESTANMQTESTFTDAGWDFVGEVINGPNDIWDICEGTNYPKFVWQIPAADFVCPDGVEMRDFAVLAAQWRLEELSADVAPDGGDGIVNFLDWVVFADGWQSTNDIYALADFAKQWLKVGANYLIGDIAPAGEGDGVVNVLDFAALAENWLAGL